MYLASTQPRFIQPPLKTLAFLVLVALVVACYDSVASLAPELLCGGMLQTTNWLSASQMNAHQSKSEKQTQ